MNFYSTKPLFMYPFSFALNKDVWNLILIFILIWKSYYYFIGGAKTSLWDVANSTYKTTNYTIKLINNIINTLIIIVIIIIFVYV
jgi:hypothetical protein